MVSLFIGLIAAIPRVVGHFTMKSNQRDSKDRLVVTEKMIGCVNFQMQRLVDALEAHERFFTEEVVGQIQIFKDIKFEDFGATEFFQKKSELEELVKKCEPIFGKIKRAQEEHQRKLREEKAAKHRKKSKAEKKKAAQREYEKFVSSLYESWKDIDEENLQDDNNLQRLYEKKRVERKLRELNSEKNPIRRMKKLKHYLGV